MNAALRIAALVAAGSTLFAQEEELKGNLAGCARIELDAARLDCFDQLARAVAQIPPELPKPRVSRFKGAAEPGRWRVEGSVNPVDDSKAVALGLVDASDSMQLVLVCQHAKPEVYVNTAKYLGVRGVSVVTRFGEAKAETKRWTPSRNRGVAVWPAAAAPFIARMLTVERLVVQVSPDDDVPITAVFKVDGLPDVIAAFKEICPLP